MQFSSLACYFPPLGPKYTPRRPVFKYRSFNDREQFMHSSHILLQIKMYTCTISIGTELLHIFNENMVKHPWQ
jgi:hypothetical protein